MGPNPDRITSSAIPVFYFPSSLPDNDSHPEKLIKRHWALIGFPSHCQNTAKFRSIPNVSPSSDAMDISTLVAFLSEDIAVGRRPCVVFSRACTETGTVSGEWDDLVKVREVDSMSLLSTAVSLDTAIPETAKKIESLRSADSVTFLPAAAFKLSNPHELAPITFFNAVDPRVIDPLNLDLFDSAASDRNLPSVPAAHRRRSGGSAGGALIAATLRASTERGSAEFHRDRSGSISSISSNNSLPPTSRLLKRISSCSLFQNACFNVRCESTFEPTPLKFSLPWWLWCTTSLFDELSHAYQVGHILTKGLYAALSPIETLKTHHLNGVPNNHQVALIKFNTTISARDTLQSYPAPPKHVSHVPPSKRSHAPAFVPKPSPWTPGFGVPESLRALDESRKEAWDNRLNADLGTRVIFENISQYIRDGLDLQLVNFSGATYIKYKTMSYHSQSESHETLVNALVEELPMLAQAVTSTFRHQKTLQSLIASLPSRPVELRYILPSDCVTASELGLGGVHFSPTYLDVEVDSLDPQVVRDLDALNTCLANELGGVFTKATVKKSEGCRGLDAISVCVWVGFDRNAYDEKKIEKLVDALLSKGRELERSEQFLATLSEVVKRGIHEAELNLKKKHVSQEETSILHSLPMIGTVLNLIGAIPPAAQHSFLSDLATQTNRLTSHNFTLSRGFSTVEVDIDLEKTPTRESIREEERSAKALEHETSVDATGETGSNNLNPSSRGIAPGMRELSEFHLDDSATDDDAK
ncbi:hypothetical protein HDU83_000452 [Entophlyctis luteolus]|nr:hypothetical protein HDU83_000452 [Entophlyctis luteolus]